MASAFADETDFPKIGSTYLINYLKDTQTGGYFPQNVKIIKHGLGEWFLVESDLESPKKSIVKDKTGAQITQEERIIRRIWINFNLVETAQER